jgi:hypothetical protein
MAMNLDTRRVLMASGLIIFTLPFAFHVARYRQYVYAGEWHCFHTASIRFGMHRIEIPPLWWPTQSDKAGRFSISRACKTTDFVEPVIRIEPSRLGEATENDADLSSLVDNVVSRRSGDPSSGWTHSVVTVRANASTWYCVRGDQVVLGHHMFTSLNCNAAKVPYSLAYQGPPAQENEAESIFATFQ